MAGGRGDRRVGVKRNDIDHKLNTAMSDESSEEELMGFEAMQAQ